MSTGAKFSTVRTKGMQRMILLLCLKLTFLTRCAVTSFAFGSGSLYMFCSAMNGFAVSGCFRRGNVVPILKSAGFFFFFDRSV